MFWGTRHIFGCDQLCGSALWLDVLDISSDTSPSGLRFRDHLRFHRTYNTDGILSSGLWSKKLLSALPRLTIADALENDPSPRHSSDLIFFSRVAAMALGGSSFSFLPAFWTWLPWRLLACTCNFNKGHSVLHQRDRVPLRNGSGPILGRGGGRPPAPTRGIRPRAPDAHDWRRRTACDRRHLIAVSLARRTLSGMNKVPDSSKAHPSHSALESVSSR
jgi:hypothetical protein